MSSPLAIVLAAGKGTRMKSDLPKVLVPVCGRPMVRYVVEALQEAGVKRVVVVVGYKADLVREELAGEPGVAFVEQTEQLGTGHAVMVCRQAIEEHFAAGGIDMTQGDGGPVVIVTGDSPMLQVSSLRSLLAEYKQTRPACLIGTAHRADPTGLGRIVRDASGDFRGIVEEKDATEQQRAITEVNMSTYVFHSSQLLGALDRLTTENAQAEYYITDCPGILQADGVRVEALAALQPCEALSVNTVEDLAAVEEEMENQNRAPSA